jgi:hypothetical protein
MLGSLRLQFVGGGVQLPSRGCQMQRPQRPATPERWYGQGSAQPQALHLPEDGIIAPHVQQQHRTAGQSREEHHRKRYSELLVYTAEGVAKHPYDPGTL